MSSNHVIRRFEHQRLHVGDEGFGYKHFNSLCKLNQLHAGKYFEIGNKNIKFSQYVGVIQVDDLSIEIHPKADRDEDEGPWQGVLLQMLKATGRLKPSSMGAANVKRQNLNLLEVYFELYLHELQKLIHQGLVKRYRKRTANSLALKGRLEFAGNISKNLVHKERFYTTHTIYDHDHKLHQMLAHALDIVEQFTRGTYIYDQCRRVLLEFPSLSKRMVTAGTIKSIKLDRKSAPYQKAFELARLIILNYSPDISSGREKMLSLLFDMNQLWEEYILKRIKQYVQDNESEFVVQGQDEKSFWGSNTLRPDIVLSQKDLSKIWIIDTKWKRPENSSASVSDLRQMYAYNKFWESEKALLLYPGEDNGEPFESFHDGIDNGPNPANQCKMGFVHVLDQASEQAEFDKDIGRKVFGMLVLK